MSGLKETVKKVCEYCGKEFIAGKTTTRCCSHLCNSRAYKDNRRKDIATTTERLTATKKKEKTQKDFSNRQAYSIAEAAQVLGKSRMTIYRYVVSGKIKAFRCTARTTFITKKSIDDFLEQTTPYEVLPNNERKPVTEWYSLDEAATKYGIKYRRLRDIINKEHIPEKKDGRNTFIGKNQTDNYFNKYDTKKKKRKAESNIAIQVA